VSGIVFLALAGCAPDLHETAGPIVPIPNLTGAILRTGAPAPDRKVRLIDTPTDSTVAEDRTDPDGRYAFVEVPQGSWTIKVTSQDSTDFASVTYSFSKQTDDESIILPPLELHPDGLQPESPAPVDTLTVPSLGAPLEFHWTLPRDPDATVQVRLLLENGPAVWYSIKTRDEVVRWNGIGNQGTADGHPVAPGRYVWRLREENGDTGIESTTTDRVLVLIGGAS
jgi:hypothetical protein